MKKLSNKGFTLIELLAVITIMGILMMVAIPAVSRTIENSRRDTFADIAHEYVNAVRNAYIADNISCFTGGWNSKEGVPQERVASATSTGNYFFPICTDEVDECYAIEFAGSIKTSTKDNEIKTSTVSESLKNKVLLTRTQIVTSTTDLMESGGKSPFGSSDIIGFVRIQKAIDERDGNQAKNAEGKLGFIKTTCKDSANETAEGCIMYQEGDTVPDGYEKYYKKLDNPKTTIHYYVKMVDTGLHGISDPIVESKIKRASISTAVKEDTLSNVDYDATVTAPEGDSGIPVGEVAPADGAAAAEKVFATNYLPCFIN